MKALAFARIPILGLVSLILNACGPSEATVRGAQQRDERAMQSSSDRPGEPRAGLRVVIHSELDGVQDTCGGGDSMSLLVLEGSREITRHDYCSAYGLGGARLVTDARGRHFVLLEHGEGRGNRSTTMYLTIFELTDYLIERAQLLLSEPVTIRADWVYRYRVDRPSGGGIVLSGIWQVGDGHEPAAETDHLPVRNHTVLEIDTAHAR